MVLEIYFCMFLRAHSPSKTLWYLLRYKHSIQFINIKILPKYLKILIYKECDAGTECKKKQNTYFHLKEFCWFLPRYIYFRKPFFVQFSLHKISFFRLAKAMARASGSRPNRTVRLWEDGNVWAAQRRFESPQVLFDLHSCVFFSYGNVTRTRAKYKTTTSDMNRLGNSCTPDST